MQIILRQHVMTFKANITMLCTNHCTAFH